MLFSISFFYHRSSKRFFCQDLSFLIAESRIYCKISVFNLTNNIDVESTKKMVDNYKKENKDFIQKNKSKLVILIIIVCV